MTNRRSFLKQASLAFAPFILPSHIWSAKGDTSPNNRINIAIIGPGKMGRGHAHKLIRNPRAQLTGFAEIADVRTQHTKELIEKHYSKNTPGAQWKGLKITKDYLELLEDAFGPDDAWGMALNYAAEEDEEEDLEEDDEQPIPDGYSGDGFLETLEEIKYELHEAIATRSLCRRYGRNGKEKQEQLIEYDRRIDRLEHLLKNFENTVSTEVEA